MWTSNIKKYYFFLLVVLLIGLIAGILFLNNINESTEEILLNNINDWLINLNTSHINSIVPHILILSLFLVLSSFCIGMPLYVFYVFYNGFSLGFIISSLGKIFGFKGFLYSLFYILITKGLYIFLVLFFLISLLRIGEKSFLVFLKKADKNVKNQINLLYKKACVLLAIIFISDMILYFLGGKLLNIFNFLII